MCKGQECNNYRVCILFQEYTENLLQYVTTMVCVSVRGRPTAGVIHKPFEDLTAWGWDKGGRTEANFVSKVVKADFERNGGRTPELAKSRLIVSRSHAGAVHNVTEKVFGSGAKVTPAGGAGYKSWEVVKGEQGQWKSCDIISGSFSSLNNFELELLKHMFR